MADSLTASNGVATITGTTVYTVPAGAVATLIGMSSANTDTEASHWVGWTVGGRYVSGPQVPIAVGSTFDPIVGRKIVATEGQEVVVFSDTDVHVDVVLSFLEQTGA